MRKLILLLLVLLGWLQYSLWLGKRGIHDLMCIRKDIMVQKNSNDTLKLRNDKLFIEIKNLNNNYDAIEERSRNELGMIKLGETFYRVISEHSKRYPATYTLQDNR